MRAVLSFIKADEGRSLLIKRHLSGNLKEVMIEAM